MGISIFKWNGVIDFISFHIFFQNLSCQTGGVAYLRERLIDQCLHYDIHWEEWKQFSWKSHPQTLCFFCLSLAYCSIPHRRPGFCWLYLMVHVGVCAFTNLNASANHQWILWLPSWTGTHGDCQWHTCMVYHSSLKAACQESFFQKAHLKVYSNLNHATRLKIHYNLQ